MTGLFAVDGEETGLNIAPQGECMRRRLFVPSPCVIHTRRRLTSARRSGNRADEVYARGSILTASRESLPRRVCVIGNSSIGAVRMALGDRGAPGAYEFAFFASGGPKFDAIALDGDRLTGFEVDSGGERDLRCYDAFVLQGRLPTAYEALAFERHLAPLRYSQTVQTLALRDWRESHKGWTLALTLHERYGRPALTISRNVFASERAGERPEREAADAAFAQLLAPLRFVALPQALFEDDGQVARRFYSGYVNVHGRQGPAATPDEWHYNREAGGLILDSLIAQLDAAFA